MQWEIQNTISAKDKPKRLEQILDAIISSRHLKNQSEIDAFFHPQDPLEFTLDSVGINSKDVSKAVKRIQTAINQQEKILIFGDYDADGITATAILWETLHQLTSEVFPFIPDRHKHGYGLSVKGIEDAIEALGQKPGLVITVDNGIMAHPAATYLRDQEIDLIITDHHQQSPVNPTCLALVHSDQISGSAVAWFLAKSIYPDYAPNTLDLVTIGTIADMMPLVSVNRSLVKFGLIALKNTRRLGLIALFQQAEIIDTEELSPYHVNFIIAPRLNAMGRLTHAIDSLRLLCTLDNQRADDLSTLLNTTNKERQNLTQNYIDLAEAQAIDSTLPLIIIKHEDFHQGIIGLVAGKLTEKYHKPTIIISIDGDTAKASARSVSGVNIIELIRQFDHHLLNAGGHPLAAGFSILTQKIDDFINDIQAYAQKHIDIEALVPKLKIDCELELADLDQELLYLIHDLKPFGMGNPEPIFCLKNPPIFDYSLIGKEEKHLRLILQDEFGHKLHAIGFNMANKFPLLESDNISIAFHLQENHWKGKTFLQLHLKDIVN